MIENVELVKLEDPSFIKLKKVNYTQNGVNKSWEIAKVHDSVAILIYHKTKNSYIFVKQFRPAVYLGNGDGYTIELCAGIVDKDMSLKKIACEEVFEECGYKVYEDDLKKITSFYTAVGFAGSSQTLYYVEVDDTQKVNDGGGIDLEEIELIYMDKSKIDSFIFDESYAKTPGLMFALLWHQNQTLA